LDCIAELVCERFPALPVVFRAAVFDRDDRIVGAERSEVVDVFGGCERFAFAFELVFSVFEILCRGAVEGEVNVFARRVACLFDRLQDKVERFAGGGNVGRKAAFIANAC
jgi:hypothetical protein